MVDGAAERVRQQLFCDGRNELLRKPQEQGESAFTLEDLAYSLATNGGRDQFVTIS